MATNSKDNHIFICLANNYGYLQTELAVSLFEMQGTFNRWCRTEGRRDKVSIIVEGGYSVDRMRSRAATQALQRGATHILMLDADMSFPKQMLVWMIEDLEDNEDQEIEAITGLNTQKRPPYFPLIYIDYNKKEGSWTPADNGNIPLEDLFEVKAVGCASLMIKAEVFKRIEQPYFLFQARQTKGDKIVQEISKIVDDQDLSYLEDTAHGIGEDLYFFKKAKPRTLCDPRIRPKHYGLQGGSIKDYVQYNNLKVKDGKIVGKDIQFKKIKAEYDDKTE